MAMCIMLGPSHRNRKLVPRMVSWRFWGWEASTWPSHPSQHKDWISLGRRLLWLLLLLSILLLWLSEFVFFNLKDCKRISAKATRVVVTPDQSNPKTCHHCNRRCRPHFAFQLSISSKAVQASIIHRNRRVYVLVARFQVSILMIRQDVEAILTFKA